MNALKRFFQEDIPAVFSAGKWRLSLMQLNARITQLEKQKNIALNELGSKAWESRVKDGRYSAVYEKLEELDAEVAQTQQEIDSKQNAINQETEHLNSARLDFDNRLKSAESQRQTALQKLTQLQSTQKGIELHIGQLQTTVNQGMTSVKNMQAQADQLQSSDQADKDEKVASLHSTISTVQMQVNEASSQIDSAKAELVSNQSEQSPILNEVNGYDQLIKMLQEQSRSAASVIQENLKRQQQDLLKVSEKKNGLLNRMSALIPDLGNQVYRHRPTSDDLSAAYAKADAAANEIKQINDQVNLTQARLASVSGRSVQKVVLASGALVFLVACVVAFAAFVVPAVSSALKPDPKRDIRLVQSWTLENCSAVGSSENYLDISVWENRRADAIASVEIGLKLLGSNGIVLDTASSDLVIAPKGAAVSVQGLESKGSRVQEVSRSVSSVIFNETSSVQLSNVTVETFFEKTRSSNNVSLSLEITNGSDFSLKPNGVAYAFVVNQQNRVVDILVGNLNFGTITIDSLSKISFQSLGSYGSVSCLQSDYSQQKVTFWYFVPFEVASNSKDQLTISGSVEYAP